MKAPKKIYIPAPSANLYKNDGLLYKGVEYISREFINELLEGFNCPVTKLAYNEIMEKLNNA